MRLLLPFSVILTAAFFLFRTFSVSALHSELDSATVALRDSIQFDSIHLNLIRLDSLKLAAVPKPVRIAIDTAKLKNITSERFINDVKTDSFVSAALQIFPDRYSLIDGVLTFRGNHTRTAPSFGVCNVATKKLQKVWEFKTAYGTSNTGRSKNWGGGAGWTGQAALVRWTDGIKNMMNLKPEFKTKSNFVEVIQASLDGRIYFLDLETGKKTREPIDIKNPVKGSLSIDPRGYPLLYVGQGIPENGAVGFRIFSLIDQTLLHFIAGKDTTAFRSWGAFDASGLVNRETDTFFIAGENGLFYSIKLNTVLDTLSPKISIAPETMKYRYRVKGNDYIGIENSPACYKNLAYFADNGGTIQALDLLSMKPVWLFKGNDDTDASLTIDIENDTPFVYTGCEVDKQGTSGFTYLRKLHGLTGAVVWEKPYKCQSVLGPSPVNGGLLATSVVGKQGVSNLVFFTAARSGGMNTGVIVALDKATGKEIWKYAQPNFSWSSPVAVYDSTGKAYLVQSDCIGDMTLLDAQTGKLLDKLSLNINIEASPAVFNDMLVVAVRGQHIYGVRIK
jgi:outer membrane protein assembly factor BamB